MANFTDLSLAWYNSPAFVDMTDRQRVLLILICRGGQRAGVRELAHAMNVQKPVITRATNTMGAMGLIQRVQDGDDRRLVWLLPTEKGIKLFVKMQDVGL